MTELAADMEQIHYVVVGIGVNANLSEFEGELKKKANLLAAGNRRENRPGRSDPGVLEEFELAMTGLLLI